MKANCNYSVALCTYNGERYIAEQLNSILSQTIPPKEIIISDDGSKDQTLEIVDNLLSHCSVKYRIVKNTGTHGVTKNFCNAISVKIFALSGASPLNSSRNKIITGSYPCILASCPIRK